MTLEEIFDQRWESLATYDLDGTTHYLGVELRLMIGLSNITTAIARTSPRPKVSRHNWTMRMLPEVNRGRAVYLLTYNGVLEMIRNNKNASCKNLQPLLDQ